MITYDDRSTLPLTVTNAEGHVTEIDLDPETGQLRALRDPNSIFERRAYDGLGRIKEILGPDNSVSFAYADADALQSPVGALSPAMEVVRAPAGAGQQTTRIDAFGRIVNVETMGFEGTLVNKEFVYDWNHRLVTETLPHAQGDSSQGATTYTYDEAGRRRSSIAPDGATTEYLYASRATFVSDLAPWFALSDLPPEAARMVATVKPGMNVQARILDHVGKPVASLEAEGLDVVSIGFAHYVTMIYGAFGGLRETKDQVGNITSMLPDAWGRTIDTDDPDSAPEHHVLSPWGEVELVTDGNGTRVLHRDKLGRVRQITRPNDEVIASWDYDGPASSNEVGRLISTYRESRPQSGAGNTATYVYEPASPGLGNTGRASQIERTVNDDAGVPQTFVTSLRYDAHGRIETITYPAAPGETPGSAPVRFELFHEYDPSSGAIKLVRDAGDPQDAAVRTYWQMLEADQGFRLSREHFGNGVDSVRQYYSLDDALPECTASTPLSCQPGLLRSITTSRNQPGDVQEISYQYDDNLNLKRRASGDALSETFMYDGFDQLTEHSVAADGASPVVNTFTYNELGNIDTRNDLTYDYTGTGLPHAVGSIGDTVYWYDAAGNQWKREGSLVAGGYQELAYNDFQMPWRITTGQGVAAVNTDIEYDASEHRVAKRSASETTIYIGDLYERVTRTGEQEHRYKVYAGSALVAQIVKTQQGSVVTETKATFVHDDHLGSSTQLTTDNGVETRRYEAFGEPSTNFATSSVHSGFTGHEHDGELGLINMRGRIYDPTVGQFLQADPVVTTLSPRGLNRYAYVLNNPLMNTDPSGFFFNPIAFMRQYIDGRRDDGESPDDSEPGGKDLGPVYNLGEGDLPLDLTELPPQEGGVSADAPGLGAGPGPFPSGGGPSPDPGMGASLGSSEGQHLGPGPTIWGIGNLIGMKLPADPANLPPGWEIDPSHRDPNGTRYRHPSGDVLDFHKGRPGKPGWRSKDHYHRNGSKDHLDPGHDVPDPPPLCRVRTPPPPPTDSWDEMEDLLDRFFRGGIPLFPFLPVPVPGLAPVPSLAPAL